MTSTTTNKKEISDFLWEWAEGHEDWGKLLINKIITTETEIEPEAKQLIFQYFLQSIGLHDGLPAVEITKSAYTPTGKHIELVSLSEVSGVNRLAKNQTIDFSKNITIIFGDNGTGKTGYSRILKTLGFSYDRDNTILSNIFENTQPKKATIKFKANGVEETLEWTGANKNAELESISVFNNSCVQISLSDRQLIVSPIGFHLFNLVTAELHALTRLLNEKSLTHSTILPWASLLNLATPQQIFISTLSASSTEEKLTEISLFTDAQTEELRITEKELRDLNRTLLETEIQNLTVWMTEITTQGSKVRTAQTTLTNDQWQALIDFNKQILILEGKAQTGIKEIAETNGITFYETEEFDSFIKSAEEYIKILNKPNYPELEDNCVYCQQSLGIEADALLKSYRTLLNDKTQENIIRLKKEKAALIKAVSLLDANLIFHQPTFGLSETQEAMQPTEVLEYNEKFGALQTLFTTDIVADGSQFDFNYVIYIDFLLEKHASLKLLLEQKQNLLKNLALREKELKVKIAELSDRKLLSEKIQDVSTIILNHKIIAKLNSNIGSFNTASISRKTTEAREQLVSSNFDKFFKEELASLQKSHINIDLSFGTERGTSMVTHRIKSHVLTNILSEGEQKAIALAEFLTELQLDNIKAPVIFDDPVNSLDNHIIDDVARRLIKLSNERQVVIFTHSVLLFNSLLYLKTLPTNKDCICKFYKSRNEYDETGFITEAEEEINGVGECIKKLNILINDRSDRPEAQVAREGYGHLRAAIELLVEIMILGNTIKRYRKNVALSNFLKVKGSLIDTHKEKLNEIFERCSGYLNGHSNPAEIHVDPTVTQLKSDFAAFMEIKDAFQ